MTGYSFGDVVLVPFPFTDQTTTRKRPAIVVSSDGYQNEKPDLILIAVISRSKPVLAFGKVKVDEWTKAGLIKPSMIKPVLTTLELMVRDTLAPPARGLQRHPPLPPRPLSTRS